MHEQDQNPNWSNAVLALVAFAVVAFVCMYSTAPSIPAAKQISATIHDDISQSPIVDGCLESPQQSAVDTTNPEPRPRDSHVDGEPSHHALLVGMTHAFVNDTIVPPETATPSPSTSLEESSLNDSSIKLWAPDEDSEQHQSPASVLEPNTTQAVAPNTVLQRNPVVNELRLETEQTAESPRTAMVPSGMPSFAPSTYDSKFSSSKAPERSNPDSPEAASVGTISKTNTTSASMPSQIGGKDQSVFQLAAQPKIGETFTHHEPNMDARAMGIQPSLHDFDPGPCYENAYDPNAEMGVYEGKYLNAVQRPLIELGRPWYQLGPLSKSNTILGSHNPVNPQFIIFGDSRIGAASNKNVNNYSSLVATQTNLFFDLKLTGTERFNMFVSPSTRGANSTRYEFDNNNFVSEFNFNVINGFFEGDLGSLWGGLADKTMPFDLPIAIGVMPLLFQNGVWMEDNVLGFAATVPARNVPAWNISNMDVTFFAGYDNVTSPTFGNDNNAGRIYGVASFVEAWNGYLELDYAFLDDRSDAIDRSYHNVGVGYTRRLGRLLSNSTRVIVNAGQDTGVAPGTADGVLLLSENSLITSSPSNIVPYLNMFAGFDRPQSAARAAAAGGVLRNTGILFESDNLTNYPTLDATANNTVGAALGVNLLANDFGQQLILESAMMSVIGDRANRVAAGPQYGFAIRYQLPLTNSILIRADAMLGLLSESEDINGVRVELRRKF